jgi:uncharacterized protein YdaU (DUF1376 family)
MKSKALWWWIDRWRSSSAFADLSLEEQGALRNLFDAAWLRGGGLPTDERVLARESGDPLAWERVRGAVLTRFTLADGLLRNATLDSVMAESARRAKNQKNYRDRVRDNQRDNGIDNARGNVGNNGNNNQADSPDPDPSPSLFTHHQTTTYAAADAPAPTHTDKAAPRADGLKRMEWDQAMAIAHRAIETCGEDREGDWVHEFRALCREQRLDFSPTDSAGEALDIRALKQAKAIRQSRKNVFAETPRAVTGRRLRRVGVAS